jgi:hypothetical protein
MTAKQLKTLNGIQSQTDALLGRAEAATTALRAQQGRLADFIAECGGGATDAARSPTDAATNGAGTRRAATANA